MVTNTKNTNNKVNAYLDSEIKEVYDSVAKEYKEFAKKEYHIEFKTPKLLISKNKPEEDTNEIFSNIVGLYNKMDKSIKVYSTKISSDSKLNRNGLIKVISHELGHSLADQLGMNLDSISLNSHIGGELVANMFAAQIRVKLENKPLTNTEIAKQLLNERNLSPYLKSNEGVLNLKDNLNMEFEGLDNSFNGLNESFGKIMDKWLNILAEKNSDMKFYIKIKESYLDTYKDAYRGYTSIISSDTTALSIYDIPLIAAAKALMNGKSPEEIIKAPFAEKGIFSIPEFKKYELILNAGKRIEDLKSFGPEDLGINSYNRLKLNLVSSLENVLSKSNDANNIKDSLESQKILYRNTLEVYKKDYDSMVKEAKRQVYLIGRAINETIRAAPEALKDLNEIRSQLYPNSDKLRDA